MELKRINMDRIILSKKKTKYEEGEVFNLAKSIALAGMLSPISVRTLSHSDRYEIIDGNKRFCACRMLGYKEISGLVIKAEPHFARALLIKDKCTDFFKEADTVKEAILKTGMSAEEFSDVTAYSVKEILSLLRISVMSELEREIIRKNFVNKKVAAEIAEFDDCTKRIEILSESIKKRMTLTEIHNLCEREKSGKARLLKQFANRTVKFRDLRLFDNTLSRALGILRDAGVKAELDTEKNADSTEYKIRIKTE